MWWAESLWSSLLPSLFSISVMLHGRILTNFISTLQRNFWISATTDTEYWNIEIHHFSDTFQSWFMIRTTACFLMQNTKSLHSPDILDSSGPREAPWREVLGSRGWFRDSQLPLLYLLQCKKKKKKKQNIKHCPELKKSWRDSKCSLWQHAHLYTKGFEGFLISIKIITSFEWWFVPFPPQKSLWLVYFKSVLGGDK